MFNQSTGLSNAEEWLPLTFNNPRAFGLLGVAGFLFCAALIRKAEFALDELLLFTMGLVLALQHTRMLFVFGLLAAPILSRLLASSWDTYDPARDRRVPNAVMLLLAVTIAVFSFPSSQVLDRQVKENNPVKAVEFIRASGLSGSGLSGSGLSGRMLNDYVYGGYLIWALPEHKVFMDGRADVYEWTGVLDDFADWAMLRSDPKHLLEKYRVDFCLLEKTAPMARVLPFVPGWKQVYSDERSVIFSRTQ
jgi:hypothetical protein